MSNHKKKERKKRNFKYYLFKVILHVALWGTIFLLLFILSVRLGFFGDLPEEAELKNVRNNTATNIYSVDNKLLGRFYLQNRTNTTLMELPDYFIDALVATEDVRFFKHKGVDYRSLARVLIKSVLLFDRSAGGGSTLTQQLAKNLFPRKNYGLLTLPVAKVKEIIIATRLEKIYSKEVILELYLNTVPFGENTYGIETAAIVYFNKQPSELRLEECAVLVGLLKANTSYNPRMNREAALKRRNVVLGQMVKYGYLEKEKLDSLKNIPIQIHYYPLTYNQGLAPYFREFLRQRTGDLLKGLKKVDGTEYNIYTDGLRIYTTINARMQQYAEEALEEHMSRLQKTFNEHWKNREPWKKNPSLAMTEIKRSRAYRNHIRNGLLHAEALKAMQKPHKTKVFTWEGEQDTVLSSLDSLLHHFQILQTGMLVLNNHNGDVLVWIGGPEYKYFQYDHVLSKRQTGSTIKPIIYANALENGISPCDFYANDSLVYENYDNWTPGNSDGTYGGYYSVKGALANSINTVSVKLIMNSGINNAIELAHRMGIESELPEVPSLALGAAEISLYELVQSYTTFTNQGRPVRPRMIRRIEDQDGNLLYLNPEHEPGDSVISPRTAQTILAMMQGVVDRGTAKSLRTIYGYNSDLAAKTGTTQNNTDSWFMALTPRIAVGVWVGGDNPIVRFRTTTYGQGAYSALPITARFLGKLYNDSRYSFMENELFYMPEEIPVLLDCEDYREEEPEKVFELFEEEKIDVRELIRRLFGKKRKDNDEEDEGNE